MRKSELIALLFSKDICPEDLWKEIKEEGEVIFEWIKEQSDFVKNKTGDTRTVTCKTPAGMSRTRKRCRVSTIEEIDEENLDDIDRGVSVSSSVSGTVRPGRTAARTANMKMKNIVTQKMNLKLRRPSTDTSFQGSLQNIKHEDAEPTRKLRCLEENERKEGKRMKKASKGKNLKSTNISDVNSSVSIEAGTSDVIVKSVNPDGSCMRNSGIKDIIIKVPRLEIRDVELQPEKDEVRSENKNTFSSAIDTVQQSLLSTSNIVQQSEDVIVITDEHDVSVLEMKPDSKTSSSPASKIRKISVKTPVITVNMKEHEISAYTQKAELAPNVKKTPGSDLLLNKPEVKIILNKIVQGEVDSPERKLDVGILPEKKLELHSKENMNMENMQSKLSTSCKYSPDVLGDISNRITPKNNISKSSFSGDKLNCLKKEDSIKKLMLKKTLNSTENIEDSRMPNNNSMCTNSLPRLKHLKKSPLIFSPYSDLSVKNKAAMYENLKPPTIDEEVSTVRTCRTKTRAMVRAEAVVHTKNVQNISAEKDMRKDKQVMKTLIRKSLTKAKKVLNLKSRGDLVLSTTKTKPESQVVKVGNLVTSVTTFLPKPAQNVVVDETKRREEDAKKKCEKENEAERKKQERLMALKEEKRKKWDVRVQKIQNHQEYVEKQKLVKKKLIEEKDEKTKLVLLEREEKVKEEMHKKKLQAQQKEQEIEERRKMEEAARLAKLKEQEEEQALRKKEQHDEKKLHKVQAKKNVAKNKNIKIQTPQVNYFTLNTTYDVSSSENDYGLDGVDEPSDDESNPKRNVPEWARNIRGKPDFFIVQDFIVQYLSNISDFISFDSYTPDLQKMFNRSDPKWEKRNSSAIWDTPPRYSQLPKF